MAAEILRQCDNCGNDYKQTFDEQRCCEDVLCEFATRSRVCSRGSYCKPNDKQRCCGDVLCELMTRFILIREMTPNEKKELNDTKNKKKKQEMMRLMIETEKKSVLKNIPDYYEKLFLDFETLTCLNNDMALRCMIDECYSSLIRLSMKINGFIPKKFKKNFNKARFSAIAVLYQTEPTFEAIKAYQNRLTPARIIQIRDNGPAAFMTLDLEMRIFINRLVNKDVLPITPRKFVHPHRES